MTWFFVDDGFGSHPKVLRIPRQHRARVVGIWTLCGSWAARHLTDGVIPEGVPAEYGARAADVAHLVAAGLWEEDPGGGWRMHDWADWQRTRSEVEDRRAVRAAAGRAGGRASGVVRRARATRQTPPPQDPQDEAQTKQVLPDPSRSNEANPNPGPPRPGPGPEGAGGRDREGPPTPRPPDAADVDVHDPPRLAGEVITVLGGLMPAQATWQLDAATITDVCAALAERGWTRTALAAALHERADALARARGAGLAVSILRGLMTAPPPRSTPGCTHRCTDGMIDSDRGPKPCPTCRPVSARRVAEQRGRSYGARDPGIGEAS